MSFKFYIFFFLIADLPMIQQKNLEKFNQDIFMLSWTHNWLQ